MADGHISAELLTWTRALAEPVLSVRARAACPVELARPYEQGPPAPFVLSPTGGTLCHPGDSRSRMAPHFFFFKPNKLDLTAAEKS